MKQSYFTYRLQWVLLLYSCFAFACCQSNEVMDNTTNNDLQVPVTMTLSDVLWDVEQKSNTKSNALSEVIRTSAENNYITAILEPLNEVQTRVSALSRGVRYRIIAYKENNISAEGYINHIDCEVQGEAPLFLSRNCTYTLVCYSYGTTSNLPAFDKNSITIAANPNTDDFMYCKQNITVGSVPCFFSVVLSHLFSKITVAVDASRNGYNITACSGSFATSYQASVSLTDGSITKDGSGTTKALAWSPLNSTVVSSNYMVCPTNETVSILLNSITIAGNPEVTLTDQRFTFSNKTMEPGKSYTLRLILWRPSPITVAGIKWAPGNLICAAGIYSFASKQEYYSGTWDGGDYFCWNTLNPASLTSTNTTSSYDSSTDPCAKVAPVGSWRMPTQAEFTALISSGSVWSTKNNINGRYFGTATAPATGTENNYVFLPAAGIRGNGTINMFNVGETGWNWSAAPNGTTSAYYFYVINTGANLNTTNRNSGFTIRCVLDAKMQQDEWDTSEEWDGGTSLYP